MPRYFKQSKYKSFQRQLHIYGFRRINSREMADYGAYYHSMFVRGERDSSLMMQRQQSHSTSKSSKDKAHPVSDPDFYSQISHTPLMVNKNEEWGLIRGVAQTSNTVSSGVQAGTKLHIIPHQQVTPLVTNSIPFLSNYSYASKNSTCNSFTAGVVPDLHPSSVVLSLMPRIPSYVSEPREQGFCRVEAILSQIYGVPANSLLEPSTSGIASAVSDRPASPFTEACNEVFD